MKVQIYNHNGNGRTRWYSCEVIGRRDAPPSFRNGGLHEPWYSVRLRDGTEYQMCNPDCVRVG